MKINLFQKNKILISILLIIILSSLNIYNLKDKAFIKLEKFDVAINNKLLAKEFGSRILLKDLQIANFKRSSKKEIGEQIKFDDNISFYTIINWNENTPENEINEIKKIIYKAYKDSFLQEKINIQRKFVLLNSSISNENKNLFPKKFEKNKLDDTTYLRELNKYFYDLQMINIENYLSSETQLSIVDEVDKNDLNVIEINKSFEKKEYLIFFALIFNQLLIFLIIFSFYKSIPRHF
tara:strand:- start:1632 stop:2342 length:711 start_codon:yes stop_codon:yes gene_type:complete